MSTTVTNRRSFMVASLGGAFAVAAVAAGCTPPAPTPNPPGPNLVQNPSFEVDAPGATISSWTVTV